MSKDGAAGGAVSKDLPNFHLLEVPLLETQLVYLFRCYGGKNA